MLICFLCLCTLDVKDLDGYNELLLHLNIQWTHVLHAVKTRYIVPSMNRPQTRQKTPPSPASVNQALRDCSVNQVRSSVFMCWEKFLKKVSLNLCIFLKVRIRELAFAKQK